MLNDYLARERVAEWHRLAEARRLVAGSDRTPRPPRPSRRTRRQARRLARQPIHV